VEVARLDEFRKAFDETVREMMTEEMKMPELQIDAEITLNEVTSKFVRILREFAPFGPANMRPTFLSRGLEVAGSPRVVGKNHLRLKLRQNGSVFDAIGFGLGAHLGKVNGLSRRVIDCVFTIEENDWVPPGGIRPAEPATQLKIKDLR
jgi:single-stranded-DNA-specific exonuclease